MFEFALPPSPSADLFSLGRRAAVPRWHQPLIACKLPAPAGAAYRPCLHKRMMHTFLGRALLWHHWFCCSWFVAACSGCLFAWSQTCQRPVSLHQAVCGGLIAVGWVVPQLSSSPVVCRPRWPTASGAPVCCLKLVVFQAQNKHAVRFVLWRTVCQASTSRSY